MYLKQRLKFSLFKTTYFRFCFLYLKYKNISKLVYLIQEASALLSLQVFKEVLQTTSIIKEKKSLKSCTKFPFIILNN